MKVSLWFDDVRPAPKGWVWARTIEQAKEVLRSGDVIECSLDHDLGYHDVELPSDPDELGEVLIVHSATGADGEEETGVDLVEWMIDENLVPEVIWIHSWNPDGARRMKSILDHHGYDSALVPFRT